MLNGEKEAHVAVTAENGNRVQVRDELGIQIAAMATPGKVNDELMNEYPSGMYEQGTMMLQLLPCGSKLDRNDCNSAIAFLRVVQI